jgi:copper chaperone
MHTEHLKVTGMSCGGCVGSVTKALKAVDGVDEVSVSLDAGEATINYDEHVTSMAILKSAVIAAGYGVDEQAKSAKGGCCG